MRVDGRGLVVLLGLAFALSPWATPPLALAMGLVVALAVGNPLARETTKASKWLLQASVVGLGFGIPLSRLTDAGFRGVAFAVCGIAFALAVGLILGRVLRVDRETSWLLAGGTAICGGSAIAAIGPAIRAKNESMNVALATVFVLNAFALYLFPPVGHALHLGEAQFGTWAAVAIHDTSSVVGAAATYGPHALEVATVTKLARAVWIAPLALAFGAWAASLAQRERGDEVARAKVAFPWFIALFLLATVARTLIVAGVPLFDGIAALARVGLTATLYLIGAGLTRKALATVGPRPFAQGLALWAIVSVTTLVAVEWLVPATG